MNKLKITTTADIPNDITLSLLNDIGAEYFHEPGRIMLCSMDPPSFIEILGDIISWKTIFIASSTVFFSTLSKKLAEDLYDNKLLLAEKIFNPVKNLAKLFFSTIQKLPRNSFVRAKIAAPNGIPNPTIFFTTESEEEIAFKLACFYALGDEIINKITEISNQYDGRITPPLVQVSETGIVSVFCHAGINNDRIEFTASLIRQIS